MAHDGSASALRRAALALLAGACGAPDPCAGAGADALASCVEPTRPHAYYVAQAELYFDTMDSRVPPGTFPAYAPQVVRWEWPPWLLLTAFGRDVIEGGDALLRAYPSIVDERDCRFFPAQPFARCRVTFRYEAHEGRPCPIYEEFSFDDEGELTFVEAWSDVPGLRPVTDDDPWAEREGARRLATRVPGLGAPGGELDLHGPAMRAAASRDPDVAELRERASDFFGSWLRAQAEAGEEMWAEGCGW